VGGEIVSDRVLLERLAACAHVQTFNVETGELRLQWCVACGARRWFDAQGTADPWQHGTIVERLLRELAPCGACPMCLRDKGEDEP
jgi:hypothetical protein